MDGDVILGVLMLLMITSCRKIDLHRECHSMIINWQICNWGTLSIYLPDWVSHFIADQVGV
jgi:hypothetical protein